jgi:NTE family protein
MPSGEALRLDLALQGGGSHGAFTWGVLDLLLEQPWLEIEAISGTSAGAMNACVMADGLAAGGREAARAHLEAFWRRVADVAAFSPIQRGPIDVLMGRWSLDHSPSYLAMDLAARVFSPYDLNLTGANPLSSILKESIDFDRLAAGPVQLFITATNVLTGRGRVFNNPEITPAVLLASACLPTLYQAVEVDGEPYWDGGYSGNPTMTPLVRSRTSQDIVLVQINPIRRDKLPRDAREIHNRINEVSFNATLLKELRMMALIRRAIDSGTGEAGRWAGTRMHRIVGEGLADYGASSKLNAEWAFLLVLRDEGRRAAQDFLDRHRDDLGRRATFDLDLLLEGI